MTGIPPSARIATRWNRQLLAAGLIVVIAVIIAALTHQVPKSAFAVPSASSASIASSSAGPPIDRPPGGHQRAVRTVAHGEAGGALPDGVTVFDDGYPAVAKLDPTLLQVLREAATDATDDGVTLYVNSGWRSPERQNQLLREALSKYGSEAEAARWVATADRSPHVSGDAVDIGHSDATAWLSEHGAEYGLCQIYRNEPWHYELRATGIDQRCPRMYDDPTQDPRMHQ